MHKITLFSVFGVMQKFTRFKVKKTNIFHIPYIIVAPLCTAFLIRTDFYKAHHPEKRGVLWLASYPVHCDWPKNLRHVTEMVCPLPH